MKHKDNNKDQKTKRKNKHEKAMENLRKSKEKHGKAKNNKKT